jgi:hypothetical protein
VIRALGLLGAGCAVLLTAAPARADLTPEGPASFMNRWTGMTVGVLTPPSVLMKARVTVSAGGRAGTVRLQGMSELRVAGFEAPNVEPVTEPDLDRDLRGDRTEDRTDLRLRATTSRAADGRLRTKVVVSNRGPLSADLPVLETTGQRSDRRTLATATRPGWKSGCKTPGQWERSRTMLCSLSPLAAGASRTLVYISNGPARIVARAEGPDLARADNVLP